MHHQSLCRCLRLPVTRLIGQSTLPSAASVCSTALSHRANRTHRQLSSSVQTDIVQDAYKPFGPVPPSQPPPNPAAPTTAAKLFDLFLAFSAGYLMIETYYYVTDYPPAVDVLIDLARADPLVQSQIGTSSSIRYNRNPLNHGMLYSGTIAESRATINVPIKGDKSAGKLYGKLVFDGQQQRWVPVVLQLYGIGGLNQRHSLEVPSIAETPDDRDAEQTQLNPAALKALQDDVQQYYAAKASSGSQAAAPSSGTQR